MSRSEPSARELRSILIHGTSGHGRVVADACAVCWPSAEILGSDDDTKRHGQVWFETSPCGAPPDQAPDHDADWAMHLAVGDNAARAALARRFGLLDAHTAWLTVIHRDASCSRSARIGRGVFVAAKAVIGPQASVGDGAIVNHAAVVDHDVQVGAFAHIAPGSILGGGVRIGARVLVGAGAVVLPGLSICDDAVVGAGAVVTRPIESPGVWKGVPAAERKS